MMRYRFILLCFMGIFFSCNPITERMENYAVHGIDVSHYQAKIDWPVVAEQNIDFAFVKATEGESLKDSLFTNNWVAMKDVGIHRGAYHFFRPANSATKQADHFIQQVQLEFGDLPPVLDIEVIDGVEEGHLISRVKTWLAIVERNYGIRPIIYTNINFYNRYLEGYFDDYPMWIARYNTKKPQLPNGQEWMFWQYGNRGKLSGIDGYVDFNVFKGQYDQLTAMTLQPPQIRPPKTHVSQRLVAR